MWTDTRDLPTGTHDTQAHAALCEALERLLGAQTGTAVGLQTALEHDPDCALAHAALARHWQVRGESHAARAALDRALALVNAPPGPGRRTVPERVVGIVGIFERLLGADAPGALSRVKAHLERWPRDALAMAPAAGVFGLFGFSGQAGREGQHLEFLQAYRRACEHDWWYQSALAFALSETGAIAPAAELILRSLAIRPESANGAHIRTHVAYEAGQHQDSLDWLQTWFVDYGREGLMHCHLGWHLALSALHLGEHQQAWALFRQTVHPDAAWGPPLNLLTDNVSFLLRMHWAGETVSVADWRRMSDLAWQAFPRPGLSFADLHAVLAHAMAGQQERLARYVGPLPGSAGDLVAEAAAGLQRLLDDDPGAALIHWQVLLEQNARLGGSRAQRDLVTGWVNPLRAGLGQPPIDDRFVRPSH